MTTIKQKRTRITLAITKNVEFEIKKLEQLLGITKFDKKWNAICNDVKIIENLTF